MQPLTRLSLQINELMSVVLDDMDTLEVDSVEWARNAGKAAAYANVTNLIFSMQDQLLQGELDAKSEKNCGPQRETGDIQLERTGSPGADGGRAENGGAA